MRFRWWLLAAVVLQAVGVVASWLWWVVAGVAPGVVGVGLGWCVVVAGWGRRPLPVRRVPDYANIARLERELGIARWEPPSASLDPPPTDPRDFLHLLDEPEYEQVEARRVATNRERGEPARLAVGYPEIPLWRGVPPKPCRHRTVIELTKLGQRAREGICRDCPTRLVDVDGDWRPIVDGHAPGCTAIKVWSLASTFDLRRYACGECGVES